MSGFNELLKVYNCRKCKHCGIPYGDIKNPIKASCKLVGSSIIVVPWYNKHIENIDKHFCSEFEKK